MPSPLPSCFGLYPFLLENILVRQQNDTAPNRIAVFEWQWILSFAFTDSFWFNAEAEVYAMSSLFIAVLFYAGYVGNVLCLCLTDIGGCYSYVYSRIIFRSSFHEFIDYSSDWHAVFLAYQTSTGLTLS